MVVGVAALATVTFLLDDAGEVVGVLSSSSSSSSMRCDPSEDADISSGGGGVGGLLPLLLLLLSSFPLDGGLSNESTKGEEDMGKHFVSLGSSGTCDTIGFERNFLLASVNNFFGLWSRSKNWSAAEFETQSPFATNLRLNSSTKSRWEKKRKQNRRERGDSVRWDGLCALTKSQINLWGFVRTSPCDDPNTYGG